MTAKEQVDVAAARRVFDAVRPGVTQRLERLKGTYLPVPTKAWKTLDETRRKIRSAHAGLSYLLDEHPVLLNMTFTAHEDYGVVHIHQCAYHCGPSAATGHVYFRICDDRDQGFHFHLRGHGGDSGRDHIDPSRAKPSITREPADFLSFVERLLASGTLPIEVIP